MAKRTKIYVYRKRDNSLWADYDFNKASNNEIIETFNLNTPQKVIDNPGTILPGRVKALAEKALAEKVPTEVLSNEVLTRSFFKRLRWLFLGR